MAWERGIEGGLVVRKTLHRTLESPLQREGLANEATPLPLPLTTPQRSAKVVVIYDAA